MAKGKELRRKTKTELRLSAQHASIALQMLLADGKIAARDVVNALKKREATIQELRSRLAALGEDLGPVTRRARRAGRRVARRTPQRAKKAISRAQRIARQAQGRYMAAVRQLSKQARAQVKAIREKSGVDTAIAAARKMAS